MQLQHGISASTKQSQLRMHRLAWNIVACILRFRCCSTVDTTNYVHDFLVDDALPPSFMLSGLNPGDLRTGGTCQSLGRRELGRRGCMVAFPLASARWGYFCSSLASDGHSGPRRSPYGVCTVWPCSVRYNTTYNLFELGIWAQLGVGRTMRQKNIYI